MYFKMTKWLDADTRTFLSRGYLHNNQTPEERIRQICETAEANLEIAGFADEFEQQVLKGWVSFSSPVWSNYGNDRGLPISCNGSFYDDSVESILLKTAEIGGQTKFGAGTSAYMGELRPRGAKISVGGTSEGPVHFMRILQETVDVISQSNIRRGNCAVYLNIEHADIMEFLECREEGNTIQDLSLGVTITDAWMEAMIAGDDDKRKVWLRILKKRSMTGYPYLFWTDTVNNGAPQWYRDHGMKIWASNLCAEVALPSSKDESFVCCLSSVNLLYYDDWKETNLVRNMMYFLDSVMEEYIQKTEGVPLMDCAHRFAKRHRSVGLGVLGWHSYLQSNMLAFDGLYARALNKTIFIQLNEQSAEASRELALSFGEPEVLEGYGYRNATRMALAPTTSSSFILGKVSKSIEPRNSNYYTEKLAKGNFPIKNEFLEALLESKGWNTAPTWKSILMNGGSVSHLHFLSQDEKDVFKTFGEVSQMSIIDQAADRAPYIDQSQSINLMIHPDTPVKDIHELLIYAWERKVKTLYYQRSTSLSQELNRALTQCAVCEG